MYTMTLMICILSVCGLGFEAARTDLEEETIGEGVVGGHCAVVQREGEKEGGRCGSAAFLAVGENIYTYIQALGEPLTVSRQ